MAKDTIASTLMKNVKFRLNQLAESYDIAVACTKCAVQAPDGPKNEFHIFGQTPFIDEGIRITRHKSCPHDWILCKERSMNVWYRIRPICDERTRRPNQSDDASSRKNCPSEEMRVNGNSRVEHGVWSKMVELGLTFENMHGRIIEGITNYVSEKGEISSGPGCEMNTSKAAGDPAVVPVPKDAVRPGSRYEEQGFLVNTNGKTLISIRISTMYTPDRLFFQICDTLGRMKKCWEDINTFYNSVEGEKYKLHEDDLVLKLPIAAKIWDDESKSFQWRRAEIKDYSTDTGRMVGVVDIDFGGISTLKSTDIRMLRREYFSFRKQAVEAAVAYVRPVNGDQWSAGALETVRSFAEKWPLVGEVVGTIDGKLALMICDTSDPNVDTYLSDVLINRGHAVAFKEVKPLPYFEAGSILTEESEKPSDAQ